MIAVKIHFDQIFHVPESDSSPEKIIGLDSHGYVWTYTFSDKKWTKLEVPTVKVASKEDMGYQRNYQPRSRYNGNSVS